VIDVRNDYETRIGKFKEAVDPCTTAFRKFPFWVEHQFQVSDSDDEYSKGKVNGPNGSIKIEEENPERKMPQRVAMYCTGGIRCEKASSYLLSKGFKEVILFGKSILCQLSKYLFNELLTKGRYSVVMMIPYMFTYEIWKYYVYTIIKLLIIDKF
jgi:predicted sulfurtransferase